jgi:DNA-binding transcriptional LysR family regulator
VEELVGKADEIRQVIEDIKSVGTGRLSLGASDTTSMYFLPKLLKAFRTKHPNVELAIDSKFSNHVVKRVLDREVDLGIITLPSDDERLDVVPLFSHRLVAVVHEGHPFRRFKSLKVSDLSDQSLIMLGKQSVTRSRIDQYLSRCRRAPRVVLELTNFEIIKHYVAEGHGISLVPEKAVEQPLPGLYVVPLRQKLKLEVGAVYRNGRTLSHSTAAFLKMAASHFARAAAPGATGAEQMSLSHSGPAQSGPGQN